MEENTQQESTENPVVAYTAIHKTHVDLKEDFVSRVKGLLMRDHSIRGYSVNERYNSETEEVEIVSGKYTINLKVSKSSAVF